MMRLWMVRVVAFLLVCCTALAHAQNNCNLTDRSVSLVITHERSDCKLADSCLVEGSEILTLRGIRIDSSVYMVDYVRGILELNEVPSGSLEVQYRVFPFPLKCEYSRRDLVQGESWRERQDVPDVASWRTHESGGLRIGGRKTFSVSVGSREELRLDQSLELKVGGEVSGVTVSGVVADDAGATGEDRTATVRELEEVYMEVEGENFRCRVGDYDLIMNQTQFCAVERNLEGVMAEVSAAGAQLMVAGAVTRKRFATDLFYGRDGVQGPYRLRDSGAEPVSHIARGSERVYLDGELLERGEDLDYVLDYDLGTIEFSPRQLITQRSRVMVEFEYAVDDFRKRVYGTSVGADLAGSRLTLTAQALKESDDVLSMPEGVVSDLAEERLAAVGNDTSEAWVDGGEHVTNGQGDYARVDGHYEYVGAQGGDYTVRFTDVGVGNGEYEYDPELGGYRYMGAGGGSHVAQIHLDLPEEKTLYNVRLGYSPTSRFSVSYEEARARIDGNSISALDQIRRTSARSLRLGLKREPLGSGELTVKGSLWAIGDGFVLTPAMRQAAFGWGGCRLGGSGGGELEMEYSCPVASATLSVGKMTRSNGGSVREGLKTTINPEGYPRLTVGYSSCHGEGEGRSDEYVERNLTITHRVRSISPTVSISTEERGPSRCREYGTGFDVARIGPLSGMYRRILRFSSSYEGESGWSHDGTETRDIVGVDLRSSHTRGALSYAYRRWSSKNYSDAQSLWSMQIESEPWVKKLEVFVRSELTSKRSRSKGFVYRKVDDGDGEYVRDPESGDYYRYDDGDYVREVVWSGDSVSTSDLKVEVRSKVCPHRSITLTSGLMTEREIGEKDDLFELARGRGLVNMVEHSLKMGSGDGEARLEVNHRWSVKEETWGERRLDELRRVRAHIGERRRGLSLIASRVLSQWGYDGSLRNEEERWILEGDETLRMGKVTVSLGQGVEEKRVRYCRERDSEWAKLRKFFVRPLFKLQTPAKVGSEVSVRICYTGAGDQIPYILSVIDPVGWSYRWSCLVNWWMSGSTSSTVHYVGEERQGRLEHTIKAEVRGYF